jgi:hypothetical protein
MHSSCTAAALADTQTQGLKCWQIKQPLSTPAEEL